MSTTELPAHPSNSTSAAQPRYWDGVMRSYIPPAELQISPALTLHRERTDDIDPITYEVVRYALMNANLEHSALLTRLSVSPVVMLARDCQSSVLTEDGDLVFLGPNVQCFSNAHSLMTKWLLENRVENPGVGPDDMFIGNDAFVGGTHQNDICVAAPVFVGDALFCWVANSMHHADVGGPIAGGFCIDATDTWQEALNWPPVKLITSGRLQADVVDLFARQSRVPVQSKMDLHAAIAANTATKAKILALVERYGADVVKGVMHRTLDAGERLLSRRLATIPDGTWSHRGFTEAAVSGDRGVYAYQVNITKSGDRLIVDNEGTDRQIGAINVSFAAFAGAVLAALTQQATSDLGGAYGGVYRRVEFRPTSGLANCAEFPAAVSASGATTTEMQLSVASLAIAKMLASSEQTEDLILGSCVPQGYTQITNGVSADGTFFVFPNTDTLLGSLAGRPSRDGVDVGGQWWIPDAIAMNVEDFEAQVPLLCLYRRMLTAGLDGAGRHRAGVGFTEAFTPRGSRQVRIEVHMGESFPKAEGLFGGSPGSRAGFRLARSTEALTRLATAGPAQSFEATGGSEELLTFKGAPIELVDGDVWEAICPSTPGYGDPVRRDPAAVAADVAGRMLDAPTAERLYAVVLDADGQVDAEATARGRLAVRRARLGGRDPRELLPPPPGARRIGELLHIVAGRWWCNGADLGAVEENYKISTVRREAPIRTLGVEFDYWDHEAADRVVLREYICPVTGYLIDAEIALADEALLHDFRLTAAAVEAVG
ncbi:hydantoinase B/oxoprolinase family protein [Nocardia harenae]|uniref:hydantoinase B/oxoprolinase family protein n=1 Tax=Nocardia harenae TaxID=358707 RepID=UPI000835ADB7|nr:hydantoinase B/oxoprolinase family protein [Nocardia harenae]